MRVHALHVCMRKSCLHHQRHLQRLRKGSPTLPLVSPASPQKITVRDAHFFLLPHPLPCLRDSDLKILFSVSINCRNTRTDIQTVHSADRPVATGKLELPRFEMKGPDAQRLAGVLA
jgi:hypothetical protein